MRNIFKQKFIALVLTIAALMVGQSVWAQAWTVKPYANDTWDSKTKTLIVEPGALFNGTCSMGGDASKMPQNDPKNVASLSDAGDEEKSAYMPIVHPIFINH